MEPPMSTPDLVRSADPVQPSRLRRRQGEWPAPPAATAFRGLAGEFVRAVEPHSEGDPVALLAQFLVYFGNVVGRHPHVRVEDDRHGANEFVVLVGDSSKGRKGTSRGRVHAIFEHVDRSWATTKIARGLSPG